MNRMMPDKPTGSTISPFVEGDAVAVANMFQEVMKSTDAPAPPALVDYFVARYLTGPFADPELPSLVHRGADGAINGFAGVTVQTMLRDGKPLKAVIGGTLMVRERDRDPMTGARLLKSLFSGKQDLVLSENANDASTAMWRQLRGTVLDRHSLDYIRVLRPASFGVDMLASRLRPARLLKPLAGFLDRLAMRKDEQIRWTGLPLGFKTKGGLAARSVSPEAFAEFVEQSVAGDALVPVWPPGALVAAIAEAMDKPAWGQPHLCEVVSRQGKPIGMFLAHLAGSGPMRVVDLVHQKGMSGPVLDALFVYARDHGASSVQGRATPAVLDALLSRRTLFAHESAAVIEASDPELIAIFERGDVHFCGFVGERWTRFIGGGFAG